MANKGNFIEAEGLVKKLNEAFTDHVKVVQMSVQTVKSLNDEYKKLPSDYAKGLKDVAIAQEKSVEASNKLLQAKKQINQKTSEEIVNQSQLRRNADLQTKSTSNLVGAYANLSAQVAIASKRYQDIIARGQLATQTQKQYNRELKQAEIQFRTLQTRVLQADKAVDKWNRTGERSIGFARNLIGAFGVVGGATLLATVTTDIINTTKELQGLNNALMLVTDTQENFYEQQVFLSQIAEDFGLEIIGLTKQFTQFYVSAKDKISGNEIQEIFRSVSKAGASMGLSVQQQERAFLALNQMMSKGTIQAEELRGQLGEALPGAFGIMAKAVGVTEKELGNMMKAGDLLASDVLPKFARQLEKTYGIENINRIETMTTATNRLSNAWTGFIETIGSSDGVISKTFTKILNFLSQSVQGFRLMTMTEAERSLERIGETVSKNIDGYKEYLATLDLTNAKVVEFEKNALRLGITRSQNARKEIDLLKEELKSLNGRGTVFESQRKQLRDRIELLEIERQKYLKQVGAFEEVVKAQNKKTEATKKETEAIKKKVKVEKEQQKLIIGTVDWLENQISQLKQMNDSLSTTSEEYKVGAESIEFYQKWLERLTGSVKDLDDALKEVGVSISDFDLSDAGLEEWYDKMAEGFQKPLGDGGDWKEQFQQWSSVALDAIQTVRDAQEQAYERELQRLERSRDTAILFAGESESARAEIDRQYDEKRRRMLNRQAKEQKVMAISEAIINTASAVIKALGDGGIPLAIAVGIIGAAQIALIASQQVPQFYKGTDNAPEGLAWTQERGAELITDKHGKIKSMGSDGGAKLTYLNKGDKVFDAKKTQEIMFNNELNGLLMNNGIDKSSTIVNNNVDLSPLNARIDNLTSIIKNKPEWSLVRDVQGERLYKKEQGVRKLLVSNHLRINR